MKGDSDSSFKENLLSEKRTLIFCKCPFKGNKFFRFTMHLYGLFSVDMEASWIGFASSRLVSFLRASIVGSFLVLSPCSSSLLFVYAIDLRAPTPFAILL